MFEQGKIKMKLLRLKLLMVSLAVILAVGGGLMGCDVQNGVGRGNDAKNSSEDTSDSETQSAAGKKQWFQLTDQSDAYKFPEPEKGEFAGKTMQEVIDYFRVPEVILKNMSTEGLIETCITYPFYIARQATARTEYLGFLQAVSDFNGFTELFTRQDAGVKMLTFYQGLDYDEVVESKDNPYILFVRRIEYLITQKEILSKLSIEQRASLKATCVNSYNGRYEKYAGMFRPDALLLILTQITYMDDHVFAEYVDTHGGRIRIFLKEGLLISPTEEDKAVLCAALGI